MPKFRITDKVSSFLDAKGVRHFPGDVVELPSRYGTLNWLEPLKKPKPVKAKEVEVKELTATKEAEAPKKKEKTRKKSSKK